MFPSRIWRAWNAHSRRSPRAWVFFESATNPVTKIADIGALLTRLARLGGRARRHGQNTFAGFHQARRLTMWTCSFTAYQYASGTGDVMGGAGHPRAPS